MGDRVRRWFAVVFVLAMTLGLLPGSPGSASHDGSVADACPPGEVPSARFTDVASNETHRASIDCVVWWAVARGTSSTTYAPANAVNRAQMATFIAQLIDRTGPPLPAAETDRFADDDGNPHETNINRLAEAGIVGGLGGGRYGPADPVSREQMATFLVNAYEYRTGDTLESSKDHFSDDDGSRHESNINKAAEAGFTGGRSAGIYDPTSAVTRAQMASFLARVLDRLVEEGMALPPSGASDQPQPGAEDPQAAPPPAVEEVAEEQVVPADEPTDGEGLPTRDDDDIEINPAGEPAAFDRVGRTTSIPPPSAGPPAGWEATVGELPSGGPTASEPSGEVEAQLLYQGQPVFSYRAAEYLPYQNLPTSVGQLESWRGGQFAGNCTATVVARDLVLTAAHCIQADGPATAKDAYRFWPDRYGDRASYGYWETTAYDAAWLPTGWTMDTRAVWRYAFDYALIRFPPNTRGQYLGDVVGIQPVLMGASSLNVPKYAIGYPTEGWFGSYYGYPWYCWADHAGLFPHGNDFYSMGWGCDMNGGSSGGPVFAHHNGRWWVVSVNSTGGHIVACPVTCNSARNSWYMRNAWGPDLHNRVGPYGFLAFWNAVTGRG
jgi:V8-like Glu-specific endopeptidase